MTEEQLSELDFVRYARIVSDNGKIKISREIKDPNTTGHVYFWLEDVDGALELVYVGKAGGRMVDRCYQHTSGFKKSPTGKKHAQNLVDGHKKGFKYIVYCRKSMYTNVFGVNVSMHSIEEEAFIEKFKPRWNTNK